MSEAARPPRGCAHVVAWMLAYFIIGLGLPEHVRTDFNSLSFEGQLLALEILVGDFSPSAWR